MLIRVRRSALLAGLFLALVSLTGGGIAYAQALGPAPAPPVFSPGPPWPDPSPTPTPTPTPALPLRPTTGGAIRSDVSPPLHSITSVAAEDGATREIPNLPLRQQVPGRSPDSIEETFDPIVQSMPGQAAMPATIRNFDGVSNVNNVLPPDTNGDAGPNHYVQWVNVSFAVWDKSGNLLFGPAAGKTLWTGFGGPCESENDGDPIALYDPLADRWLMSQFALPNYSQDYQGPFYQCIAVSTTSDPTGSYYRYAFLVSNTKMNDYPKFGVWPDGYYMTVNQFTSGNWAGGGVFVFDRTNMLSGNPATFQYVDLYSVNQNYGGMLPSDLDGPTSPPPGTPNYFVEADDSSQIPGSDAIRIWAFHVDWSNPSNSTFGISGQPNSVLDTASFDPNLCDYARDCIPQPATAEKLDAISDRLMYRLQYRNFGSHQTLLLNHTVDSGSDRAGIRWYELRNTGSGWSIYQQGTYAPDANHRWMGSIAMDNAGNIALGYTVSNSNLYPSIRYTGRLAGDPLGVMTQEEATIMAGGGSQTHTASRWGDYSTMSVDAADDCTFWYTSEYYSETSLKNWRTRIASFRFPSCTAAPNVSSSRIQASHTSVRPGDVLTYTVFVTNTGNVNASARVTDVLPANVTYVPGSVSSGGTYVAAGRSVTWMGTVPLGGSSSLTYSGVVSSPLDNGTAITNTATIYDGINAPFETAAATSTVSSAPNLTTSFWTVSSPYAGASSVITYSLTLTNTGDMNASNAQVTSTLPVNVTYEAGSAAGGAAYAPADRSVTWTGPLPVGSSRSVRFRSVTLPNLNDGTTITNTAVVDDEVNAPFVTAPVTTTIDALAPTGSLYINGGAGFTNATAVTTTLAASDNVNLAMRMALSNDGVTWPEWETYSTSKPWALTSGQDGARSIFARLQDGVGNVSPVYSATIGLDTAPPSGTLTINNGASDTNSTSLALALSATDAGAGVSLMQFSTDGQTYAAWENYGVSGSITVPAGDGAKTVYLRLQDRAGNVSQTVSDTILLNTIPPTSAVSSLDPYLNAAQFAVAWSGTALGSGLRSFDIQYRDGALGTWTDWLANYAASSATFTGLEGHTYYFRSRATDLAGNMESYPNGDGDTHVAVDLTPPTSAFSINSGALDTTAVTVTLSLTASDSHSGISQAAYSNDGLAWTPWEQYGPIKVWGLPSGDRDKAVWMKVRDGAGNYSAAISNTIRLDTSLPPAYGLSINDGALYTNRPAVTLNLPAAGLTGQVMVSNDGGFSGASWEPYAVHKAWNIMQYGSYAMPRTVYARFRDAGGLVSGAFTDDIILDTKAPTGSISIDRLNLASETARSSDAGVSLALAANDDLSGIAGMMLSSSPAFTRAAWEPFSSSKAWRTDLGSKVYVTFRDNAGNTSAVYATSLSGEQETLPPPVLATIHPRTGGEMDSPEIKALISFPPGSFPTKTAVTLVSTVEPVLQVSTGQLRGVSRFLTLTASVGDTSVSTVSKPYTITIDYATSDLTRINEASLGLYWWSEGAWQKIPTSRVDTGTKKVTATLDHFSSFAVLGESTVKSVYVPLLMRSMSAW